MAKSIFSRRHSKSKVNLKSLGQTIRERIDRSSQRTPSPALILARLGDLWRDAGWPLVDSDEVEQTFRNLDEDAWRRLDAVVTVFAAKELRDNLLVSQGPEPRIADIAKALLPLITKDRQVALSFENESPLRIEEFARQLVSEMGAEIEGETAKESETRLRRLDHQRLVIDAELNRLSGQAKVEYLRALQSADRGKW